MAVNKLIPYWITVRRVDKPDRPWDQTRLKDNERKFPFHNLADYFWDFLQDYADEDAVHVDRQQEKTFTVHPPLKREGNTIEGRFKSGEWGRKADFWDTEKHERIEDARKENHAEELPYYFLFHIPDQDPYHALLILSKYKRRGVKTLFSELFDPRERGLDVGEAYMDIEPHYSDNVIEKIEEADSIASITFRGQDTIPARDEYATRKDLERWDHDISGQIDIGKELRWTPKDNQGSFRRLVKDIRNKNEGKNFDYGRIEEENFESANVTVVEGESQLTFSLWKEEIAMRMDVDPDDYPLDIYGGYPTPHSLGCVARQLANDLMRDHNTNLDRKSFIPRSVGIPDEEEEQPEAKPED